MVIMVPTPSCVKSSAKSPPSIAAYQGFGDGERLLRHIENQARKAGLNRLFVLTTRTMHWFLKRGFRPAGVDDLPIEKRRLYNWQRRSQIFIKDL